MAIVVDAFVGTAASHLLGTVTNLLEEKVEVILNAKDDLRRLQRKLERFQKAIKEIDRQPFFSNERDRDREEELKDVFYDAQDIIDEYRTIIELNKRESDPTLKNKVRKPWVTLCSCFRKHVSFPYQLGNEIKKINQRLDEINNDRGMVDLGALKTTPKASGEGPVSGGHDNPRETTHHVGAQPPIGRESDKKVIIEKLLFDGATQTSAPAEHVGVSIITIIGQGGIGKTTLAKMIFSEVEEQFGECRWWVCVSERPSRKDLLWKILKEVYKGSKEDLEHITSLSDLCTQLQSELSKKKFLLVLDDIWELDWWQGEVEGTLVGGAMGSKILITSRNIDVSKGIGASYMHKLPILPPDQSWILFLKKAFVTENDLVSHNLEHIARKIVKKCGGLPLVVQTVGSLMRTKSVEKEDWEVIADSGIWEWKIPASSSSFVCGEILPGLILSYDNLPHYLRHCFVYCSIYPKDYVIGRDELVMQWVAHGLIEKREGIDVELTANQYITDLIKQCLIEETEKKQLKLHDIMHDLALYIGGKEYSHVSSTEHTRHLSLLNMEDPELSMYNASGAGNKLRTLLGDWRLVNIGGLTNLKLLRVLSLEGCRIHELPNSIGDLALLKYLDLSYSRVRWLPSSIGRLCNLESLNLNNSDILELPKEMGELWNLRYLGLESTRCLNFVAEGLGKLSNLRTLKRFLVCNDTRNTRGCSIRELKGLNKLKGNLSIEGLGGMLKKMDAGKAQLLKEKLGLINLELHFEMQDDKIANASEQSVVLGALQPPDGLENLKICHYKGQMPGWSSEANYAMLRKLMLESCSLWETVVGISSLETLEVNDCPVLHELMSLPSLKYMEIRKCNGLETICDMPALKSLIVEFSNELKTLAHMPSLEELEVRECDSLRQIADMPSLKKLLLCEVNTMKELSCTLLKSNGLQRLGNMLALKELEVHECNSLEQIADMPALKLLALSKSKGLKKLANMPALERLKVRKCDSLEQLADMPGLKVLYLTGLNTLKELPFLPSLEEVRVYNLPTWEGWAAGCGEATGSMPCLRDAIFRNCPKMQTQALLCALSWGPNFQTELKRLKVSNCPSVRIGWKFLNHLPKLVELELGKVVLLEDDGEEESSSEVPSFLPSSLKSLSLKDIYNDHHDLKRAKVPKWVWSLCQLEDLYLQGFIEEISLGGHWQCLQKLKHLGVFHFPKLRSLVDVTPQQNEAPATTFTEDETEQIACLSKLQFLHIVMCPALDLSWELRNCLGKRSLATVGAVSREPIDATTEPVYRLQHHQSHLKPMKGWPLLVLHYT